MPRTQIAAALVALLSATSTTAATLHVPGEYPTIEAATNTAISGDSIVVACGTYYESALVLPAGVVLSSATGLPDCVTIDGQLGNPQNRAILTCSGDSLTVAKGLTLTRGYEEDHGGGMRVYGSPIIENCSITFCASLSSAGAVWVAPASSPVFRDCKFLGNWAQGAGAVSTGSTQGIFERCVFADNYAGQGVGGAVAGSGVFTDCLFENNYAYMNGGAISDGDVSLLRCIFVGNSCGSADGAPEGGAVYGYVTATDCTFYGNYVIAVGTDVPHGSAISGAVAITNCIFGDDPCFEECGTVIEGGHFGPEPVITCTNIWYPNENAWAGSIGSQLGQNGNISVDPMFCDAPGGDFHLSSLSPCLDTPCGNMGAFGLGCFDAKPRIISITDVGNDQGRQVRLTWYRANDDFAGSPFDGYAIYRRQDLYASAPAAPRERQVDMIPGWDYVTTVPSHWDDVYQAVVPTLCDSTITSGQCWSAFMISAMTPTAFYDSPVDSGYSRDNLAPPTPGNFAVVYNTGSGNHLLWDAVAAGDWAGFRIYRNNSPGFPPSPSTLVHTTTQTTWNDPAYDGWDVYYRVTAFDLAGNESSPTASSPVSGADAIDRPLKLELGPNVPNPFNPSTTIPFTVPSAGRVTIAIFDVSGARVRLLEDQEYQPGRHAATWDGTNEAGSPVSSGVYLARITHRGQTRSSKLLLTK